MDPADALKQIVRRTSSAALRRLKRQQGILFRRWIAPRPPVKSGLSWIHIGCGELDDPRFLNVDARPLKHVHHVTDQPSLIDLPDASAELIYASHVFEHVSHRIQAELLQSWARVLAPGGVLRLSVPDFDKLVALYLERGREISRIEGPLMGGQDYPTNYHYAVFNEPHLTKLLENAGFRDVRPWRPDALPYAWLDDTSKLDFSLNLEATKP